MELNEVYSNLCYYDKRNPDGADDEEIEDHNNRLTRDKNKGKSVFCSCDNCFYGRAELAKEIIRILGANN